MLSWILLCQQQQYHHPDYVIADEGGSLMKLQGLQMSDDCTFSFSIPNVFFHVVWNFFKEYSLL